MNPRTRNIIIVVGALAALIVVALISGNRGHNALPVHGQKVTYANFQTKLPESGTVMHPSAESVPALVSGNIREIYVRAGDRVVAGQLLATLVNPTLESNAAASQADYQSAVANVSEARVNQDNARVGYLANLATQKSNLNEAQRVYDADVALFKQKAIPRNTLDSDRAKLEQARVAYNQAVEQLRLGAVSGYGQTSVRYAQGAADKARILNEQNQEQLAFTRITAPHSGVIQTVASQPNDPLRSLQPGDAVTPGQTIFTMAASDAFIVRAQVDEQDIINVRVGQRANITGEDFPGKTLHGHVVEIAPVATKSTDASSTARQVLTTIALDESPSFLKDGMTADVDIVTNDEPHALVVPNTAIVRENGKTFVYIVQGDKTAKRAVTLGLSNDTGTIVKSGIAANDTVVLNPSGVTNGVTVAVESPSPSPSPNS